MAKKNVILVSALLFALVLTGCGQSKVEEGPAQAKQTPQKTALAPRETAAAQMATKPQAEAPKGVKLAAGDVLMVADFDMGEKPSNIGGDFGAWDKDPADFSQTCAESFDSVNRHGSKGFAMKLDYDVDSANPAYNGFWMFLQNLDVSGYKNLSFWAKGDGTEGYTTVFKVELKNAARQVGRYYVTNLTGDWQKIVIPLSEIKGITDFSNLTEFVIVFEDRVASNKKGIIYIDDIEFTK